MSKQFENDLAKKVYRETDDHIRAYRCGYSGSNAMPQPDILISEPSLNYAVEVKGPIEKERCYIDEEGCQQIIDCVNDSTVGALAIKFQRREMLVMRHFDDVPDVDDYGEMSAAEQFAVLAPPEFNPRVTDGGRLALDKPLPHEWPSAKSGASDVDALLSGLGVTTEKSVVL